MRTTQQPELVKWINGTPVFFLPQLDRLQPVPRLLADGDGNTKTRKNNKRGYMSCGLSLSPHKESGLGNLCASASRGCAQACLNHQGLASVFQSIRAARMAKAAAWFLAREWFLDQLRSELQIWTKKAARADKVLCARLNMFSDIRWEKSAPWIFVEFPNVEFYDYTKHKNRFGAIRPNYWVTFSRSERNESEALEVLASAGNVAIVFYDDNGKFSGNRSGAQRLPIGWNGFRVLDGDETDLRFEDTRGIKHGRVIGLRLKAHSNEDRTNAIENGFAIGSNSEGTVHYK